jgi:hypothetical protein
MATTWIHGRCYTSHHNWRHVGRSWLYSARLRVNEWAEQVQCLGETINAQAYTISVGKTRDIGQGAEPAARGIHFCTIFPDQPCEIIYIYIYIWTRTVVYDYHCTEVRNEELYCSPPKRLHGGSVTALLLICIHFNNIYRYSSTYHGNL